MKPKEECKEFSKREVRKINKINACILVTLETVFDNVAL